MNKNNITIRLEKKEEYREVENLVRESFWNVYRPGCLEHFVLNQLRNNPDFIAELGLRDGAQWKADRTEHIHESGD